MDNVSTEVKMESFQAFQSVIRKSENALANMAQKGSNTTLLDKRLKALYIGLAMLEAAWNLKPHHYSEADLTEARHVLTGLFPLLEKMEGKSKMGSPQKTLIERRIKAFELAVQAMDELVKNSN
ncbi:hypothetical protein JNUCC31_31245 [Paenibacillus sp. JNUCC31]|uniref:hypothetical protein n=1 Tax=Paenibacillus sp. JNUCC-31 TaxID=2777983 RepID=UPI00177C0D9C|nr:hypothetical protein [Paenibacillus sp. JNUCC-31]QOS79083.1 hypothetical protein JNUCC31_31245 [Paenibacillus sp. JNUCC-31]